MAAILPGAVVRARVAVTTAATGVAVDPSTLVVIVRNPAGTETSYTYGTDVEVVRDSLGNYHLDVSIPNSTSTTAVGEWRVRWRGAGSNAGSGEVGWTVFASGFSAP